MGNFESCNERKRYGNIRCLSLPGYRKTFFSIQTRRIKDGSVRKVTSTLFWGFALATTIVLTAKLIFRSLPMLLVLYFLQILRMVFKHGTCGYADRAEWEYTIVNMAGKFSQIIDVLQFVLNSVLKCRAKIIEYTEPIH